MRAPRTAEAYAPAAISNFFSLDHRRLSAVTADSDLHDVGATGGGYMLSSGVRTRATLGRPFDGGEGVGDVVVNGDRNYEADTTRTAVSLLLRSVSTHGLCVDIDQDVQVPVGCGFGASAASALSAVNATAALLGLRMSRAAIAYYAHAADILCRTGLGTVSVIYRYGGAGVIVRPGAPGVAEVKKVRVSGKFRVVTASLAPYKKGPLLSSPEMTKRIARLGRRALELTRSDPDLGGLVRAGEVFSEGLGLESNDVKRLIHLAKSAGAIGASQNMVGHAIHAIVKERDVERVTSALGSDVSSPLLGVYAFGDDPSAGVLSDHD
jgi:pantoate kinase